MIRCLLSCILFSAISSGAIAQQEVEFPQAPSERLPVWDGFGASVRAVLQLPEGVQGRVPAVVLFHSGGGYDPEHYEFYGKAPCSASLMASSNICL